MRNIAAVLVCVTWTVVAEPPVEPSSAGGALVPQYGALTPTTRDAHRPRPSSQYGAPGGSFGHDDGEPVNYEFKYDVEDQELGVRFGHQERRQGEESSGQYYVLLPDGRTQHVVYTADQDGYHPQVSYEGEEERQTLRGYS